MFFGAAGTGVQFHERFSGPEGLGRCVQCAAGFGAGIYGQCGVCHIHQFRIAQQWCQVWRVVLVVGAKHCFGQSVFLGVAAGQLVAARCTAMEYFGRSWVVLSYRRCQYRVVGIC